MMNANMLLLHSAAALYGHEGAARQDARARSIVAKLMNTPPWVETVPDPAPGSQPHEPGWVASMSEPRSPQHLVVDGEVTDGLAMAWRARDALGLDPTVRALMQDRLRRVADGPYWRYPTLRLNQINWYAEVYNAASEATGDPVWLQRDLRGQLAAFVRSIRAPARNTAGSLGPGMQFHYLPHGLERSKLNVDSAEYANIVASVVRFYDAAIARGMRPLPVADEALLRRWMTRVLAGYWTHSGYLNWDTGFGFGRWHQMKKFALSQQALIAIAAGGRLSPSPAEASWAKHLLEQGFELYERKLPEEGVAPGLFYDLKPKPQSPKQALFAASRMAANAARAVAAGLPAREGLEPPALYSFDPAVGRLAVTTPRYNTAITAVTNGAYPYGGIDLARLYDGRQEVAATLGARVPSAFGIVARDRNGRIRLATAPAGRQARRAAAATAARPARRRQRRFGAAPVRRAVRRPARDRPARRQRRRRAVDVHVPPQLDHRGLDRAGDHAPAPQRRGAVPEHGRRASRRVGAAARRSGGPADRGAARDGSGGLLGPERALGLRGRADRSREGRDGVDFAAAAPGIGARPWADAGGAPDRAAGSQAPGALLGPDHPGG